MLPLAKLLNAILVGITSALLTNQVVCLLRRTKAEEEKKNGIEAVKR